ncbi:hypothetical protein [Pyrococcus abyssi]|uniref:KaiC-like domain-containing protein n=1 Tax=Pyrococcus abyssi (strain GE5 / Orsay) TaxID=272844 RepID=Q9V1K5_PYRAB|nr:hypothetical protein [Pyrococcus abyssi]CAB49344.1 Hypothetical protein PAB2067 [Pyrococcus abyssi GE5]CCE69802.1 TPA: hypothetical protein PAB2067 [Pyrococcus abyssi GE5]
MYQEFFTLVPIDIEEIDRALGGGLIRGATISIMYDAFSLGWALGFEILKNLVKKNSLGVIHNYNLPTIKLISRAAFVGLNIKELGEKKEVLVVDIFGSKYDVPPYDSYVFQVQNPTPETLNPKIESLYESKIFPIAGSKRVVKLVYTLDGLATMFGEDVAIKLLNGELAWLAKMYSKRNVMTILLLNVDMVSKKLIAWTSGLSDIVITFQSFEEEVEGEFIEKMTIVKSLHPEFEPTTYEFKVSTSDHGRHVLDIRRIENNKKKD